MHCKDETSDDIVIEDKVWAHVEFVFGLVETEEVLEHVDGEVWLFNVGQCECVKVKAAR